MAQLLSALCNSVERACLIAIELKRFLCSSLIESKDGDLKNENAQTDFKTFADVLIQQVITRDIITNFQDLEGKVFGEESDKIVINGETVYVNLPRSDDDFDKTFKILTTVLRKNEKLVATLTDIIHKKGTYKEEIWRPEDFSDFDLDHGSVAFWIDPIDCTNQYIKASLDDWQEFDNSTVADKGLPCVTCLVGAFDIKSGAPVLGIIAQPFVKPSVTVKPRPSDVFKSELIWGVYTDRVKVTNIRQDALVRTRKLRPSSCDKLVTVLSSSSKDLFNSISPRFDTIKACGAGYKCLTTILGFTDCFLNSTGGIYFWDLCAPHAILLALGGDSIEMSGFREGGFSRNSLMYSIPSVFPLEQVSECCLKGGVIFVLHLDDVLKSLQNCFA